MRKNVKRSKKMSVVAQYTAHAAAIMLVAFVVVIMNMLANSNCSQMMKSIGEKERVLARLEDERMRESARWEEMKTPEKLEQTLVKHGRKMRYAKETQIIRVGKDGEIMPGQLAVAKARQRNSAASSVAMNSPRSSNRGQMRSRR